MALRSAAVLLVLACASGAAAQRPMCSDALSDGEVRARLAIVSGIVRREEPAVRRWFTTFAFLHATMASGAAILAASAQDDGFRNEMLMGTLSSALGLTTLVIFGPPEMGAGDGLRALPEDTPEERLHKLRVAEDVLRRSAASIDFLRSWVPATLSTLYVVAAASTLLLAFDRASGAMTHSIGGALIGLGRILLRPTGSREAWRGYLRAHPDADCDEMPGVSMTSTPEVALVPYGLGLGLRIDF
jgi:hypothetical protein